ncbi:MAG: MBOAT family O-acyltransferase [Myxococcota bacterium]|nr:MBOAT family O-acyltransferase [Myxococcota bacterium]
MLFNSLPFVFFAAVFFGIWPLANRRDLTRWGFLSMMSLVFYGWWDWRFIFVLVASGLIDFFCAGAMQTAPTRERKRLLLLLSLAGNVGSLGFFKYGQFVAAILDSGLSKLGAPAYFAEALPDFTLILPVGISFYTFQSMSYSIDVYRGRLQPTKNFLHFFAYLSMFPQLVAGPIVRARDMLGQLATRRVPSDARVWHGIKLFGFGLFRKAVIGDHIGGMVNAAFDGATRSDDAVLWWMVTLGFGLQIYADFSGYSLMARGLAKGMGLRIHANFRNPYLSLSLREFWQRWHISLSTWFRDYVYIPLGGSRKGVLRGVLYMSITMIVSGLWHGAAITFVVWGAIHALFLGLERTTGYNTRLQSLGLGGKAVAYLLTMLQVGLAWLFFRADTIEQANQILVKMFTHDFSTSVFQEFPAAVLCIVLAVAIEFGPLLKQRVRALRSVLHNPWVDAVTVGAAYLSAIFLRGPEAAFIYFQF